MKTIVGTIAGYIIGIILTPFILALGLAALFIIGFVFVWVFGHLWNEVVMPVGAFFFSH